MTSKIRQQEMDLLEKYKKNIPVDVMKLARDLDLRVYEIAKWPDDLCGKIIKSQEVGGRSGYAIYVNKEHSNVRKRFTIAHEIAHFLLHKDEIGDGITDDALYRSTLSGAIESMANQMAANILMPWDRIQERITSGDNTVEILAKQFNVSVSAMSIRLGIPSN